MKASTFSLSIDNNLDPYLKFEGEISDEEKPEVKKHINYDGIIELRERAMLTRKLGDEKSAEEKKIYDLYKQFSERVSEIEKVNQLLKKLGEKGYSENIQILVKIQEAKSNFLTEEKRFNGYEDCIKYFNNILIKTTENQINYYKDEKSQLIRYIYGRQFILLKIYQEI